MMVLMEMPLETAVAGLSSSNSEPTQRLAVCEISGLVAVAAGGVVTLYRLQAGVHKVGATLGDMLPFVTEIALSEYADDGDALLATCVRFVAPGMLLVGTQTSSMSAAQPILLGFRIYTSPLRLEGSTATRDLSVLVQLRFMETIPMRSMQGSVLCIEFWRQNEQDQGSSEGDGAVVLLFSASSMLGVFQWRERFSDRQISVAELPGQTLVAASASGSWLALVDADGSLFLLDMHRFGWDVNAAVLMTSEPGKRLRNGICCRSDVVMRDNPLNLVRLVQVLQVGHIKSLPTVLRWWCPLLNRKTRAFLLAGMSDGSLSVMKLKQKSSSFSLLQIMIYPSFVGRKKDPIRSVSLPIACPSANNDYEFQFSITSDTTWRFWTIQSQTSTSKESTEKRIVWPSLKESLGIPTVDLSFGAIEGAHMIPYHGGGVFFRIACDSMRAEEQCTFDQIAFLMSKTKLQLVGRLSIEILLELKKSAYEDEVEHEKEEDISSTEVDDNAQENEQQDIDHDIPHETSRQDLSVTATIQDKYQLPSTKWKKRIDIKRDDTLTTSCSDVGYTDATPSSSRMSLKEYDEQLVMMAKRVDRLSSTLKVMRNSLYLFTQDIQTHLSAMSVQLEEAARAKAASVDTDSRSYTAKAATVGSTSPHTTPRAMEKGYTRANGEASRFDESLSSRRQYPDNNQPMVQHLTEKFDPDHPDADWGGLIPRSYKKRYFSDQSNAKDSLTRDEKGGIMPGVSASSVSTTGRKLFDPHERPSGDPSMPGLPFQSSVYQVGPGGDRSNNDWKTSYASQTSMEATGKDQYAPGTRHNSQHKRHVTPMHEQAQAQISSRSSSPFLDNNGAYASSIAGSSSQRPLSGRGVNSRRSLLAGIGKIVASEDVADDLVRPELHLTQSYLDPANKTLLTENHPGRGATLGYTGKRSW